MVKSAKKVFAAVSGGVDSATTAALLLEDGFECEAVFMITHDRAESACEDAKKIAKHLGIKLHVLDFREDFQLVLDYFCEEYKKGRTPNPCVFCNRNIKFGKLWPYAQKHGADMLATGHYCRTITKNNVPGLYAATNLKKDQSYALAMIDRSVLGHLIFPMGVFEKHQTRKTASKFGLHIDDKPDSQELCFIPDNDYIAKLEYHCPELARQGNIIDPDGNVLGTHNGVHRFTVGQRRGLKVALGKPAYVVSIDAETNTVVLGGKNCLMHKKLVGRCVNWLIDRPAEPFDAKIKIRYNHSGAAGRVYPQQDKVIVEFDEPIASITPGQAVVFYIPSGSDIQLAGGAWIESAFD